MQIPFDQPGFAGKFQIAVFPEAVDSGDGVVLAADREGLRALATLFRQLADSPEDENHVHIGYDEQDPFGAGVRVVLHPQGRVGAA
jgi:hypothetical protein